MKWMTTPKDVDFMSKGEFEELKKYLTVQPIYIGKMMSPTYSIHRNGKLYGYIGIKIFEHRVGKL